MVGPLGLAGLLRAVAAGRARGRRPGAAAGDHALADAAGRRARRRRARRWGSARWRRGCASRPTPPRACGRCWRRAGSTARARRRCCARRCAIDTRTCGCSPTRCSKIASGRPTRPCAACWRRWPPRRRRAGGRAARSPGQRLLGDVLPGAGRRRAGVVRARRRCSSTSTPPPAPRARAPRRWLLRARVLLRRGDAGGARAALDESRRAGHAGAHGRPLPRRGGVRRARRRRPRGAAA